MASHIHSNVYEEVRLIEKLEGLKRDYDSRINRLVSLLNEREDEISKLTEQDAFLKEELRRLDRTHRRENLNSE